MSDIMNRDLSVTMGSHSHSPVMHCYSTRLRLILLLAWVLPIIAVPCRAAEVIPSSSPPWAHLPAISGVNLGFETPVLSPQQFILAGSLPGFGWRCIGGVTLSANKSGFTDQNPAAPQGQQVCVLQGASSIAQTLDGFDIGMQYRVSLMAAQRADQSQMLEIFIDDTSLGQFIALSSSYGQLVTRPFTATARTHTLRIVGVNPQRGDYTMLIDDVRVTAAAAFPDGADASEVNRSVIELSDPALRKTSAQWLASVRAQDLERRKYEEAHLQETLVLYGATQVFACYHALGQLAQWPIRYQQGYEAYQKWWSGEGAAAFASWRHDGFPATSDRYYFVLHAIAMNLADTVDLKQPQNLDLARYKQHIVNHGRWLLFQGCSGQGLSPGDLADLRLYAMYYCQINVFPASILPGYLGWEAAVPMNDSQDAGVGITAPDFTLPRMEEVLARPTYSDQNPFDEMNVFRPGILQWPLQIMDGYEAEPDGAFAIRAKPYDHAFTDPVTLSSFRGRKPVLLMFEDATDTWDWSGTVASMWGPLYQIVKDRCEMFLVHTTVLDQIMPGYPGANMSIPGQKALHPVSLEARARTAKICFLSYPTLSVPYLLDDLAEHVQSAYESAGGGSNAVLVDTHGTISFSQWQKPANWNYMWLDASATYTLCARNERVMNLIECNLKTLLEAGGVWSKDLKPVVPDWQLSPSLENVQVTGVDDPKGSIIVTDHSGKPLTIAVDRQTRIVLGQKRCSLDNLKVGQVVSLYYQTDSASASGYMARLVASPDAYNAFWTGGGWWVPAVVQTIDLGQGTVQVTLTLSQKDSKGLALWRSASPELMKLLGNNAAGVQHAFDLLTPSHPRVLTLHVDRATELFLDGMKTHLAELKAGDALSFEISDFSADDAWPPFIRVYRY